MGLGTQGCVDGSNLLDSPYFNWIFSQMNRRNFFKGLCALAVAPLAAALPILKPKEDFIPAQHVIGYDWGGQDFGAIVEAQITENSNICGYQIYYLDKDGNIIERDAWVLDLAPETLQDKARRALACSIQQMQQALQNPEVVKQLSGYGYKVDYEALARIFQEVA